jgi:2-dehydro-3-deoxyphosphogluconate aldolase / (4S)-4-hydroxy-2-oxoglutarate aldolase
VRAEGAATAVDPIDALGAIGVIPVVVIDAAAQAGPLAEALMSGGINGVEIALRTPASLAALEVMAAYDGLLAGAGTLLEPRQAAQAAGAGARFAVSPGFDPELLDACRAQSLPFLPGVATATEIQRILRAGVQTCKFFPAESCGGLPALAALAGPFPEMRFVATGGISPSNAARYLRFPSVHAVAGTWLAPRELISEGRWDLIRHRAAEAAQIVRDRELAAR